MAYTPVELRHITLKKGLGGYKKDSVDTLISEIADSFEDVWRERADLADRVEHLESELSHHREREALLSNTLLAAERSAAEQKEDAHHKAEQVVAEAHAEARSIVRTAIGDREKLLGEIRRVRSLLRSALEVVDEGDRAAEVQATAQAPPPPAADERKEEWPKRDDTREFENPARPSLYLSSEPKDQSA
jgi:cell division septum initiation protein DivIVA